MHIQTYDRHIEPSGEIESKYIDSIQIPSGMNKLFFIYFLCLLVLSIYYFGWTDDDDDEIFHSLIPFFLFLFAFDDVKFVMVLVIVVVVECRVTTMTHVLFFLSPSFSLCISFLLSFFHRSTHRHLVNKPASSERTSSHTHTHAHISFDHTHVVIFFFFALSFISTSSSNWSRPLSHQLLLF